MDPMAPQQGGGGDARLMAALAQDPSFREQLAKLMAAGRQGPPMAQQQPMGGGLGQLRGPNEMFGPAGQAIQAAQMQSSGRRGPGPNGDWAREIDPSDPNGRPMRRTPMM
jgi:hypothetical protein